MQRTSIGSQLDGDWLTPTQVAKALPKRNGKHVSLASIWRYLGPRGCRGVRLTSTLIGGRRMVARADLEAWLEALSTSSAAVAASSSGARQSAAQRAREDAEAERLGL